MAIVDKSLVCDASLALDAVAAVAAPTPNRHIPLISLVTKKIALPYKTTVQLFLMHL